MDVAATSISLATNKVMQEVSTSMLKKTMDSAESQATALVQQMMPPVSKELGTYLDVRA